MPDHGTLHDVFRAQASNKHGAQHDEFHAEGGKGGMDKLTDKFPERKGVDRYGERWDNFPWQEVDGGHGLLYDEGFSTPTAHTGDHGTWHDQFKAGSKVRYMADGADYEGVVISLHKGYAKVRSREGAEHEVLPGQVLAFTTAEAADNPQQHGPVKEAEPGNTPTDPVGGPQGERPSGASRKARGGGPRRKIDPGMDSVCANKTLDETLDDLRTVAKAMDASETAAQAQDLEGGEGKAYCKRCDHTCRKVVDGKCPTCGGPVTAAKDDD